MWDTIRTMSTPTPSAASMEHSPPRVTPASTYVSVVKNISNYIPAAVKGLLTRPSSSGTTGSSADAAVLDTRPVHDRLLGCRLQAVRQFHAAACPCHSRLGTEVCVPCGHRRNSSTGSNNSSSSDDGACAAAAAAFAQRTAYAVCASYDNGFQVWEVLVDNHLQQDGTAAAPQPRERARSLFREVVSVRDGSATRHTAVLCGPCSFGRVGQPPHVPDGAAGTQVPLSYPVVATISALDAQANFPRRAVRFFSIPQHKYVGSRSIHGHGVLWKWLFLFLHCRFLVSSWAGLSCCDGLLVDG